MTYFNYERIAEGYANHRPHFQLFVMDMLKEVFQLEKRLDNGLDVGCGAGSSTTALRKLCRNVVGIDEAEAMLKMAKQVNGADLNISYKQCGAEHLTFETDSFDIVTVCGAINWIDEKIFLPSVHDILKNQGILLIYDNFISDAMKGSEDYTSWWYEGYLKHFPKPPRKENVWKKEEVLPYGFTIHKQETYTNTVSMTQKEFIAFIMTQSNVIAQVEQQGQSLEEAYAWFEGSLDPIFKGRSQELVFEGYNWYLVNQK